MKVPFIPSLATALLALPLCSPVQAASPLAETFTQWGNDPWVRRSFKLADLGFTHPVVLTGTVQQKDLYLPVPPGLPVRDASLWLNGHYLQAEKGRTTLTVSTDDFPVSARALTEEQGDMQTQIGIDGLPRPSGFVRIGLNWASILAVPVCTDTRAPGNSIRFEPDSRFSYRFNASAVHEANTAWGALPLRPLLLLPPGQLGAASYDSAWRIGEALLHADKPAQFVTLPAVGDTVQLPAELDIPAALRALPAFAALQPGEHRIADKAEIGALLALGKRGPLGADVLIADAALTQALQAALDALGDQIKAADSAAFATFQSWRQKMFSAGTATPGDQLALRMMAGNPVIAVGENAGPKVAGLLDSHWRPLAQGKALTVDDVVPDPTDGTVLLTKLSAIAGSTDVVVRTDRNVNFSMGALSGNGALPKQVVLDLSVAPNAGGEPPIVAVFLNDLLLGAQPLVANGHPQRMVVDVPRYAVTMHNELRVTFLRQSSKPRCLDDLTPYPVSVMPTSHILLGSDSSTSDFLHVATRLAAGGTLLVPTEWQARSAQSLPQLVLLANAVGVVPGPTTKLQWVSAGQHVQPNTPFLAISPALLDSKDVLQLRQGQLEEVNSGKVLLNLSGIERTATLEVNDVNHQPGVVYRNLGAEPPAPGESFQLTRGNVAVVNDVGLLTEFDTKDTTGSVLAHENDPQSPWDKYMALWVVLVGLVIVALLVAKVVHMRAKRNKAGQ
ncbi:MAG: cellulose biosynthesis cyclic di-GMP-binding regulatory protein BcsB [Burkholderiaceae bacterium]|jgi:hypothetical protein|nr:cellulose biosynthesis cyclic di-GMP-binding regulatory protein BcsB [Burkholderiaceae bacterium]